MITPNETTINISLFEYFQLCKMRKKYQKIAEVMDDYFHNDRALKPIIITEMVSVIEEIERIMKDESDD